MSTDRFDQFDRIRDQLPLKMESEEHHWPEGLDNFLLICGKPSKPDDFWELIAELRHSLFFSGRGVLYPIVLIAPESMKEDLYRWYRDETKVRDLSLWGLHHDSMIYVVFGTARSRRILKKARVEKAQRALVLSDSRYFTAKGSLYQNLESPELSPYSTFSDLADEEAIMTVFTLRDYYYEKTGKDLPVGAELENSDHKVNFIRLGVEDIINTTAVEEKMLANALLSPSSSYLFLELVSFQENGTEIYREPIPASWTDVTSFGALLHTMIQGGRIAVGVVRQVKEGRVAKGKTEERRIEAQQRDYASREQEVILFPKPNAKVVPGKDEVLVIGYAKMKEEEFPEISPQGYKWSVPVKHALARYWSRITRFVKQHPRWSIAILVALVIYFLAGTPSPGEIFSSAYNFITNVGQSVFCR